MADISISKRPTGEALQMQKKFFQKTARGRVIKVLRERYLREEVGCGIEKCTLCESHRGSRPLISGGGGHKIYPPNHFLLPGANTFLQQMDLFECSSFSPAVIIFQSVLEEMRTRSLPLFNRINALTKGEKKLFVFHNDFMRDTAVLGNENGSLAERHSLGIRKAMAWYNSHLQQAFHSCKVPTIVLITDDAEQGNRAEEDSYTHASKGLQDNMHLLDILADDRVKESAPGQQNPTLYPEYWPTTKLAAGMKSGELHQGYFNPNQYNYLEGNVTVPSFSKPLLLIGRENMNCSVQGDVVAVQVLPELEWRAPRNEVVDQDVALQNDDADDSVEGGETEDAEAKLSRKERQESNSKEFNLMEKQPTGRVVGIIKRNWRLYVCHIDRTSLTSSASTSIVQQTVFATPVDRRLPRIRIRTRQAPLLLEQKILVSIDRWEKTSRYPEGHFAELESLLLEYDMAYRPFGKAILACLPMEGDNWVVPPMDSNSVEWRGREDLRVLNICSINPPGCQDIDDALHARLLPNGNVEVGIYIADVSHFVHPETPMDSEAASRGMTVYMVDKRVDMLPSLLGTNLCSLRPYVERLAFSVFWSSDPVDIEQKALRETNSLVEEFMLLANISVAQKIQEAFPHTAVLRRHCAPPKTNFETLQDILIKRKGLSLDVSSSGALADSLDKCIDPDQPSFNTLVRIMATRCMLSAEYFCSGSVSQDTFGHYGLATPIYTHFTSPIRRYADVLAHRQLSAAISYTPLHPVLHSKAHIEQIMGNINRRHRMAQMAGRASIEFYVGLALKARSQRGGVTRQVEEDAYVIRAFRNGISVFVSALGIEGLVTFKHENKYDPNLYTVSLPDGAGKDVTIAVFDKVRVKIEVEKDKNTQRGKVKMTLASPIDSTNL
ncbi:hypothetical protein BOTBODRAFT_68089 [Botryobasidium botryosum FD-172 SS1]|uniref:Ribosomal RNA-processing protein 44 n=1 Tax=Botryobasidium botryosum (strain FD-172 SS1) TaxID=930990 RepID=A0A067MGZ6_BOTB1|nr:hypothetical protein BOTBODRAFT_68089 [Botryobasidium botryosum FD-172 SS1]